jgi:hypothetical protein
MQIIIFNDACLYNKVNDETLIYGQYKEKFNKITILQKNILYKLIFCKNRNDFLIKIKGKQLDIKSIIFLYNDKKITKNDIVLKYPFEKCDILLNNNSSIITTMCKDYGHRLDEWINYNLKLGFSGIVIFNNNDKDKNISYKHTYKYLKEKYKKRIWIVDFNYKSLKGYHWNTIQRISLSIGVNAFRYRCKKIALIDADEFIYLPFNPKMNINLFLSKYNTITMKSNILTNKMDNDIINNNVLDLALYVGEDKYTKTILDTTMLKNDEFIISPHEHPTQLLLNKNKIIHFHCWMNNRYKYNNRMKMIGFLKNK